MPLRGSSWHNFGLAIDVNIGIPGAPEWLVQNALDYGFAWELVPSEVWHIRYFTGDKPTQLVKNYMTANNIVSPVQLDSSSTLSDEQKKPVVNWFRYIPRDKVNTVGNNKYLVPPARVGITVSPPFKDVPQNSLMFLSSSQTALLKSVIKSTNGSAPLKIEDDHSYVVVYNKKLPNGTYFFKALKTAFKEDILYFLSAEDHPAGQSISGRYHLYFGHSYLKYVDLIVSGANISKYGQASNSKISNVLSTVSSNSDNNILYNFNTRTMENYFTTVNAEDETFDDYGAFSYYNSDTDWFGYSSSVVGAKVVGYFTGPAIRIKASKNPDAGKILLRIFNTSKEIEEANRSVDRISDDLKLRIVETELHEESQLIDLYSPSSVDEVIYENYFLSDSGTYYFLIEVVPQDNPNSRGSNVKLVDFQYLKSYFLTSGRIEFNRSSVFV